MVKVFFLIVYALLWMGETKFSELLAVVRGKGVCGDAVEGAGCQDAAEKQGRKCCGGVVGGVEVQGKGGGYTQEEDAEEGQKGVADDAKVVQHSFCPLVACHGVDGGGRRAGCAGGGCVGRGEARGEHGSLLLLGCAGRVSRRLLEQIGELDRFLVFREAVRAADVGVLGIGVAFQVFKGVGLLCPGVGGGVVEAPLLSVDAF